jgi:hypothetical protein
MLASSVSLAASSAVSFDAPTQPTAKNMVRVRMPALVNIEMLQLTLRFWVCTLKGALKIGSRRVSAAAALRNGWDFEIREVERWESDSRTPNPPTPNPVCGVASLATHGHPSGHD